MLEDMYTVSINGTDTTMDKAVLLTRGLTSLNILLDESPNFFNYDTLSETWVYSTSIPTEAVIKEAGLQLLLDEILIEDANEYARNRKTAYDALNQFELMTDDAANSTTLHADAIAAIKAEFPKP